MFSDITGAEIAHYFVDALQQHFLEALPIVIGFLALVAAVTMVIALVRSRGRTIDESSAVYNWDPNDPR